MTTHANLHRSRADSGWHVLFLFHLGKEVMPTDCGFASLCRLCRNSGAITTVAVQEWRNSGD